MRRRTTDQAVRSIKGTAATDRRHLSFLGRVTHIRWQTNVAHHLTDHMEPCREGSGGPVK